MKTREEAIEFCLKFTDTFEDYPFRDKNWTVMRHRKNNKVFAWIFEREGYIWINVKCEAGWLEFYRQNYRAIVPAYHLNKNHWNSIILDGTIPEDVILELIAKSYHLTKPEQK